MHIAAVTGWGQEEDRQKAREAGCDSHFTKPLSPETLEDLLATIAQRTLEGRRSVMSYLTQGMICLQSWPDEKSSHNRRHWTGHLGAVLDRSTRRDFCGVIAADRRETDMRGASSRRNSFKVSLVVAGLSML